MRVKLSALLCPVSVLWLVCLGSEAQSQTAVVIPDTLLVQPKPALDLSPVATLHRGASVTLEFSSTGDEGVAWCGISIPGKEIPVTGYVRCSDLNYRPPSAVVPSSSPAQEPETAERSVAYSPAAIEHLLQLAGLHDQLRRVLDNGALGKALAIRGTTPAQAAELSRIMSQVFTPDVFLDPIRRELRSAYDPVLFPQVVNWYQTPLARRVTAAETRASAPEHLPQFLAYARRLREKLPPRERLELANRLDAAVDISALQLEMVRSLLTAVAQRLNPKLAPANRLDASRLEGIMQALETQRPALKQLAVAKVLYTYDIVPDKDFAEYVQFWESEPGRWFRNAYMRGSLQAVQAAALQMTDLIVRSADKSRSGARRSRIQQ